MKLLRWLFAPKKGEQFQVSEKDAEFLVKIGRAEEVKKAPKKRKSSTRRKSGSKNSDDMSHISWLGASCDKSSGGDSGCDGD